jgi:hypothetical protein
MADGSDGPILNLWALSIGSELCEPVAAFAGPIDPREPPEVSARRSGSRSQEGRNSTVRTVSIVSRIPNVVAPRSFGADGTADGWPTAVPRQSAGAGRGRPASFATVRRGWFSLTLRSPTV